MGNFPKDMRYLNIQEQFNVFIGVLEAKIENEEKQLEVCIKNNEIETKLAQEIKLHTELTEYLSKTTRRHSDLDRVCALLKTRLTIADSDQERLNVAKDTVQIAKEITGVRPVFSTPLTVAKGHIKSHSRKLLQPFELPVGDPEALWTLIKETATPGWTVPHKKNRKD